MIFNAWQRFGIWLMALGMKIADVQYADIQRHNRQGSTRITTGLWSL